MKGGISVDTEHLFPIIKKWLYSEKEIFLREIVSNASDAVTKLKRLASLGEAKDINNGDFRITVRADKEAGTLTVSDNGIGMNEDEIRRYICQIALSGALDFINKYEGENGGADGIIGHFGLGFYSAFMVSDKVELISKSWDGSPAVGWECNDDGEYEILPDTEREERGTDVIMYINEDEKEFLEERRLSEVLNKYCAFVPVPIFLEIAGKEEPEPKEGEEKKEPEPINDTHPLWQKQPSECTDEEYETFYHKVFTDFREPFFHIHINADYPLNFKGILYFPRINTKTDALEGQIKLYYNQIFVSDSIKELLPDYLLMLRGVIDCPELPLNVSRSYMQNSEYIKKMAAHITKKVADKINSLFNTEREKYEKLWDDIKLFVEFAAIRDRKFYDRVKDALLFKLTDGRMQTVSEYLEAAKEKHEKTVYYVDDAVSKAQYVKMFTNEGIDVVLMDTFMDTQIVTTLEMNEGIKMIRVDAELADALKGDGEQYENEKLVEAFKKLGGEHLTVKFENLRDEKTPAILSISEQSRRFNDMMKIYRMAGEDAPAGDLPTEQTLILNANSPLIKALGAKEEVNERAVRQIYYLALISQRPLTADEMTAFMDDSYGMIGDELK
ncbi:MAG: molecular chaperone HtpG [Clostridia bacterium]|nr:molecular chaperone HtpG [Clostridia bacterium]